MKKFPAHIAMLTSRLMPRRTRQSPSPHERFFDLLVVSADYMQIPLPVPVKVATTKRRPVRVRH